MSSQKILILAPHPDDETIGCGGAAANHALNGDDVAVLFLTSGELGLKHLPREEAWAIREREAKAATELLGINIAKFLRLPDYELETHLDVGARELAPLLQASLFDVIYLPHPADAHPDHAAVLPMLSRAIALAGIDEPWLLGYEVWAPMNAFDHVEDISGVFEKKLQALGCYPSQLASFDYVRATRGLNEYRGELAAKCLAAEVFQTLTAE